ncbi:hypothetical protein J4219_03385 [Candidatus Woesearchaeota archaeon]|nr:hypothetical protein [Candidatus Woesearchaeota archaeon]
MNKKGSMWALLTVAAIALATLAIIGTGMSLTGDVTGPRPPRIAPLRPVVIDRPETVVYEQPAASDAMADEMAQIERSVCYLINLQLDKDAGLQTPPERISTSCPLWI